MSEYSVGNVRNRPCICGSGQKIKQCHGEEFVRLRLQRHDSPSRQRWGAFLDDTDLDFDPATGGPSETGVKSWHAVMVPPKSLSTFMVDSTELVWRHTRKWGLDELHWHDLMNDEDLRERVDLADVVALANEVVDLIETSDAFVVMQSYGGPRDARPDDEEAIRELSGLRTGDARDDLALFRLLTWVFLVSFGDAEQPADEVLCAIDQRSGAGGWTAGATPAAPVPGFSGGVLHVAGTGWPEVQIADLVAFGYQRVVRDVTRGKVSGPYRELIPAFSRLAPRTFSAQMTYQRADFEETSGKAALGLQRTGDRVVEHGFFDYLQECYGRCVRRGVAPPVDDPQAIVQALVDEWRSSGSR